MVTFGLWIALHPDDLQQAFRTWWSPTYPALELRGLLGNAVPPWGLLGAPVTAVVRNPDEAPYCDSSVDPTLSRVLTEQWPHEQVLPPCQATSKSTRRLPAHRGSSAAQLRQWPPGGAMFRRPRASPPATPLPTSR